MDSTRTAGSRSGDPLSHVVFAAAPADVTDLVVNGKVVVSGREHRVATDPGELLSEAIDAVLNDRDAYS